MNVSESISRAILPHALRVPTAVVPDVASPRVRHRHAVRDTVYSARSISGIHSWFTREIERFHLISSRRCIQFYQAT
ncbi:hypothetical protein [Burkholderia multivorans]|uniref:hypothetical protein n=2 Tax=Burkholderia multivorans TaxID=87883 RepID=UPI001C268435|nr:hypothetical protein [Burkholderia multivorans]MBU9346865.1 hypothetical protein [Burkholderia multivorans]MBU9368275.1 hypothetical protein [Burkholderia multivorans]MCL4650077.1 hypothetical protein [Burkholderia multivorans]MCL4656981.1 hypothetical protein [Burkholderia multivorans]MCO1422911.1 hypothetical protein [Burkholderia multivorans]